MDFKKSAAFYINHFSSSTVSLRTSDMFQKKGGWLINNFPASDLAFYFM